ncbi:hypothetical protein CYY_006135 [Polysphondylium violaceum]|uniref:FNIP repeat-containing protein n=1 Tax=Polysphondylium violaceum TaxID=133409 RepID=A0A8J4PT67_9MYCE|nr:hypothetical protein CYY_006135 [Polysphondylium violaceum]
MMDQLFFSVFRNKYLFNKIVIHAFTDYIVIKNILQLDKQYDRLVTLNKLNIPVVYHILDINYFHFYNTHKHKHLITHVIVSSYFYKYHLHLLKGDDDHQQQQQQLQQTTIKPILFGISTTRESDPLIPADELPASIKYFKYTIVRPISKEYIPESVTSLYLGVTVDVGVIPNTVKTLVMYIDLPGLNPPPLVDFNIESLPKSLTSFSFHDCFFRAHSFNLEKMPPKLVYLNIKVFKGSLIGTSRTGSIKYLVFCSKSMSEIPSSVTYLYLDDAMWESSTPTPPSIQLPPFLSYFSYIKSVSRIAMPTIPKLLPPHLKSLALNQCLFKDITRDNCPPGVLYYKNVSDRKERSQPFIPPSATNVNIFLSDKIDAYPIIPPSVTTLKIKCSPSLSKSLPRGFFPNNITTLTLCYDGKLSPGTIPFSVTKLKLQYSKPIKVDVIPYSVKKLSLSSKKPVKPIIIPTSVTTLGFEYQNQIYPGIQIPTSIKTLKVANPNIVNFPFHLFPSISTFCSGAPDSRRHRYFEEAYDSMTNFPKNIKIVKLTHKNRK